ncbi:MAG: zinc-dependent alcohol dehydrogenase family protein [Alphaproteobacteria bacterium]|jgi:NADPH2:quinone reductase
MKIVRVHEYGDADVMRVEDLPMPEPGPGEVRVRAEAIGVGVPDMLMRSGNYNWIPPFPFVPGNELAGTVDAVGAGVTRFREGDRAFVSARELPARGGGYAEAFVVPAEAPFAMPDGVSAEQAVTLGNYQLGWLLLNYAAQPQSGQTLLIHAAAGGAGSALVQLAKRQGLTVFGIAGGADKARYVSELGADAVIDRNTEEIGERVAGLTGGNGVDFIYDSVAGPNFTKDFGMLGPMGMVVQFGYIGGPPKGDIYKAMRATFGNSVALRLFSIHVLDDRPDIRRNAMEEAMAALAAGEIAPRIHATLKLEQAADSHRLLESGTVTGKVVLVP